MLVAKITAEKAEELTGKRILPGSESSIGHIAPWYYNPLQLGDGSWIVSLVEAQYLSINDFEVVEYIGQLIIDTEA